MSLLRHHRALITFLLAAATEAMQVGPRTATAPLAEPSCLQDVAAFHSLFGAPVVDEPALPDAKRCALRVNLLQEELDEFKAALEAGDVVEAADALADIQYVLAGAVHELGMGTRFKAVGHTGLEPRSSSLDPGRTGQARASGEPLCCSRVRASPWAALRRGPSLQHVKGVRDTGGGRGHGGTLR